MKRYKACDNLYNKLCIGDGENDIFRIAKLRVTKKKKGFRLKIYKKKNMGIKIIYI